MFGLSICLLACVTLWACEAAGLDLCKDYRVHFDRIFTVPQEAALLTCRLVNKHLFDVVNTPYNVTWYDQRTGLQITGEEDHTVVNGASLWFLNSTVEHQGKYLCVVRTPENCYKQAVVLKVSQPNPRECGRPQTTPQLLKSSVNDNLTCPLNDYAARVTSYSIQWYKGCELLQEGPKFAFIGNKLILLIRDVSHADAGLYTCRMTFVLSGVVSEAAETIECVISEAFKWRPHMIEPTNEDIKVTPASSTLHLYISSPVNGSVIQSHLGSMLVIECRVFAGSQSPDSAKVGWLVSGQPPERSDLSGRVFQSRGRITAGHVQVQLVFLEVYEEDTKVDLRCVAEDESGRQESVTHITLQDSTLV